MPVVTPISEQRISLSLDKKNLYCCNTYISYYCFFLFLFLIQLFVRLSWWRLGIDGTMIQKFFLSFRFFFYHNKGHYLNFYDVKFFFIYFSCTQ